MELNELYTQWALATTEEERERIICEVNSVLDRRIAEEDNA